MVRGRAMRRVSRRRLIIEFVSVLDESEGDISSVVSRNIASNRASILLKRLLTSELSGTVGRRSRSSSSIWFVAICPSQRAVVRFRNSSNNSRKFERDGARGTTLGGGTGRTVDSDDVGEETVEGVEEDG